MRDFIQNPDGSFHVSFKDWYAWLEDDHHTIPDRYWDEDGRQASAELGEEGLLTVTTNVYPLDEYLDIAPWYVRDVARALGSHINTYVLQGQITRDEHGTPRLNSKYGPHYTLGTATYDEETCTYDFDPFVTVLTDHHPANRLRLKQLRDEYNAPLVSNKQDEA